MATPDPIAPDITPPALREAALTHLARYAATAARLRQVLRRRIARAERAGTAPVELAAATAAVEKLLAQLEAEALLDDAGFAARRGAQMLQSGRSPRAIAANLRAKGVPAELTGTEEVAPEKVLGAALVASRRRRIGPYRTEESDDPALALRELGILARAGFPQDIARRALHMDRDEAEARIHALRHDG